MKTKQIKILLLVSSIILPQKIFSQEFSSKKQNIYKKGWIDLNKNNKKDIYEDPTEPVEKRIEDLLLQMNLKEKTNQLATLYGYGRVLKDSLPMASWKFEIWKDGIGNIDEHLNGFKNWDSPSSTLDLVKDIDRHVWAMNKIQAFFIEDTRLGIPVDFTNEGLRGVEAYGATDFPSQQGLGNTWDRELIFKVGEITAIEGRAMGYTNIYAPVLDVTRDQRWGRIEESYGESPYLVAQLGIQMTNGMQKDHRVVSTAKHYAIYSSNFGAREGLARTDPQIPFREALAIHLYPFEQVIKKANLLGVMASYNDYDGVPIIGSKFWLTDKLRQEFGFKGYVVSDSDAVEYLHRKHKLVDNQEDAVAMAVNAGLNIRTNFTPPETMILPLRKAVMEGKVSEDILNDRVRDILRVKFWLGLFDHPYIKDARETEKLVANVEHQAVALRASRESLVLLKNENNILPLDKNLKNIAVIGPNATNTAYSGTHYGPQGIEAVSVLQGIKNKLGDRAIVNYAKGVDLVDKNWPESEILPQPPTKEEQKGIDEAVALANDADAVVLVLGGNTRTAGENKSRTSLSLPGHQLDLAKAIHNTGKPIVVVFINSMPITFNWIDKNVPGILEAWYPGALGGTAIADVLFGDYNPGGKLTVTIPKSIGQLPMNFPTKPNAQSDEGETARIKGKLYPFGYGLSYTTFKYDNLKIVPKEGHSQSTMNVSMTLENTGSLEGDEIIQLYVRPVLSSLTVFDKSLRGFERVHLKPGEKKTVNFSLTSEDLAIWTEHNEFVVESGKYKIMVGASSEDIKLEGQFELLP